MSIKPDFPLSEHPPAKNVPMRLLRDNLLDWAAGSPKEIRLIPPKDEQTPPQGGLPNLALGVGGVVNREQLEEYMLMLRNQLLDPVNTPWMPLLYRQLDVAYAMLNRLDSMEKNGKTGGVPVTFLLPPRQERSSRLPDEVFDFSPLVGGEGPLSFKA